MKKNIFDQYVKKVCERYGIDTKELFSRNKKREISDARQLLYFLCFQRPMKKIEIVRYMEEEGLKVTPTNVRYSINRVNDKIKEDKDYIHVIREINSCVTH